jgi:hypothetical protein
VHVTLDTIVGQPSRSRNRACGREWRLSERTWR